MEPLLPLQSNTFYEKLKSCLKPDLRDNRGKVHGAALALTGVIIGLYRNRDGVLSGIHRSIQNTHSSLCHHLGLAGTPCISGAQLPMPFKKINADAFAKLLFEFTAIGLNEGEKRSGAVVQAISHESRQVYGQAFYNGHKESERPCIQRVVTAALAAQKITLDALHLIAETLKHIAGSRGTYLVGLKENRKQFYDDMVQVSRSCRWVGGCQRPEKGHGRIDTRTYKSYDSRDKFFDERWAGAEFKTLYYLKGDKFAPGNFEYYQFTPIYEK